MNKLTYTPPQTRVYLINGQEILNAISSPTSTSGADGLGVSADEYEDEIFVKSSEGYDYWF